MAKPDILTLMGERDVLLRRLHQLDTEIRKAAATWSRDRGYLVPLRPEAIRLQIAGSQAA